MILGGFGSHFGCQNGIKMDSKCDQKKMIDFWNAPGRALKRQKAGLGRALAVPGRGGTSRATCAGGVLLV